MKTYETWEAIKMITDNGKLEFVRQTDSTTKLKRSNNGNINFFTTNGYGCEIPCCTWILATKPVTFDKVLEGKARCKVEHALIDEFTTDVNNDDEFFANFNSLDNLLYELSNSFNSNALREIIKNGKWFLE